MPRKIQEVQVISSYKWIYIWYKWLVTGWTSGVQEPSRRRPPRPSVPTEPRADRDAAPPAPKPRRPAPVAPRAETGRRTESGRKRFTNYSQVIWHSSDIDGWSIKIWFTVIYILKMETSKTCVKLQEGASCGFNQPPLNVTTPMVNCQRPSLLEVTLREAGWIIWIVFE